MEGIGKSFGYEGKNVVITGAASGMGYEAARLLVDIGAKVYALDIQNVANLRVAKYIKVDLSKKDSIDNAIAQLPGEIDKIFCFAGVGGLTGRLGTFTIPKFVSIHFTGQRHLIENLLPHMRGNAIVWVASIGGTGWQKRLKTLLDFVKTPSYEAANKWIEKHLEDPEIGPLIKAATYVFAKEAIITYVKLKAWELASKKIRINTISPAATETPLIKDVSTLMSEEEQYKYMTSSVGRPAKPIEQAWVTIFLNSDLASYISGQDVAVDYGWRAAVETGVYPLPYILP